MHISKLDLNLLRVLEAIASVGSITGAAKKLNLTQPAVSHALNRLREQLEDPLFLREGRGLQPSPYTREILPQLRVVLGDLERVLAPGQHFNPLKSQQSFTLAIHRAMESVVLPPLMKSLQQQAPEVSIQSVKLSRYTIEQELRSGAVDLAVDVLLPVGEQIEYTLLQKTPMVVVTRKDHSRITENLTMDGYLQEKHILVSSRREGLGYEDQQLASLEKRRTIALRLRDYQVACQVVSSSDLLLTLPQNYARQLSSDLGLQILPLPYELPSVSAYLYWCNFRRTSPALLWLRETLLHLQAGLTASNRRHQAVTNPY
ncbi:LysR family transcriptional regulator [uncultured Endozoicomonas sp.]|uniref:LysR family transcriptional regulator n=1 Tax=uncultured Endozoicomonas sp. TaxID=432652 RepID=UPI00261E0645|nr:LysR family transcriptional regulator [uncultured Endozoicomonas sp.]